MSHKWFSPLPFLRTHIHLSMYLFSAVNGHMKVLFHSNTDILIVQWSRHKRRKLKWGPKGQANKGGSGAWFPGKFWNFILPKMWQSHFSCKSSVVFSASSFCSGFGIVTIIRNNSNPTSSLWLLPSQDVYLNLSILTLFICIFLEYFWLCLSTFSS